MDLSRKRREKGKGLWAEKAENTQVARVATASMISTKVSRDIT
jgi:hypothetical protein